MGITVYGVNKSIDLGCGGFNRLKTKISELINEEISEHYKKLNESMYIFDEKEKYEFFKKYDAEIVRLDKKYEYKYNKILYFLYADDSEATIEVEVCKELYELIKDYDDDILYGYCARKDCAMFKDFKEIIKECIDSEKDLEWH